MQSISGTGALAVGFAFMALHFPRWIYISNPTWPNHPNMIAYVNLKAVEYPYYDPVTRSFDCEGMLKGLENAVSGSVVLLHVCAHNPTGVDPTQEQWKQIAAVMKKNSLIPFFDSAYQGFATGDVETDAWPIRYFLEEGLQMLIAQSFAKNMGLYGERVGCFHVVAVNKDEADRIFSQLRIIIRKLYTSPPLHGALIAGEILTNKEFLQEWKDELRDVVAKRIIKTREALRGELQRLQTPGSWKHITDQIGMFSYTGLSQKQCEILTDKYHIYLLKSGRISMAGVNSKNLKYLAESIRAAILEAP